MADIERNNRIDEYLTGAMSESNLQKITCIILRNLFGLDLFSHQSCATGTLLLQKKRSILENLLLI